MAVYTHGVTNADVLEAMEGIVDVSQIDANSDPIATGQIDTWINEGAARINAALTKLGHDETGDLGDDNATAQVAEAIKSYGAYKLLRALGWPARAKDFKEDFDEVLQSFNSVSSSLNIRTTRTLSDTDTSSNKTAAFFSGKSYKF